VIDGPSVSPFPPRRRIVRPTTSFACDSGFPIAASRARPTRYDDDDDPISYDPEKLLSPSISPAATTANERPHCVSDRAGYPTAKSYTRVASRTGPPSPNGFRLSRASSIIDSVDSETTVPTERWRRPFDMLKFGTLFGFSRYT